MNNIYSTYYKKEKKEKLGINLKLLIWMELKMYWKLN